MKISSLCVFCGSATGKGPGYANGTIRLAEVLTERKVKLVYGGANIGLMKILANRMLERGGWVTGVMPQMLVDKEVAHEHLTEMHIVSGMQERKALMADLSDGFIALPGGFGTFDELFEVLSWNQLRIIRKPVGLLNVNGFFDPLLDQIDRAVQQGFLRQEHQTLLLHHTDPGTLIDGMELFEPVEAEKWIDRLKDGKI